MRRSLIATAGAALILAAPAAAELPKAGVLVPGRSLGGDGALGRFYGTCTAGCRRRTWYFTYGPFTRRGLAVEFTRGRVSGLYTVWRPAGWHGTNKLRLGSKPLAVHVLVGPTRSVTCGSYEALVRDTARARTAYYLYAGRLWGFGLFRRGAAPCR